MAVLLVAAHAARLGVLPAAVRRCCGRFQQRWSPRPTRAVRERVGDDARRGLRVGRRRAGRSARTRSRAAPPSASTPRSTRTARARPGRRSSSRSTFSAGEVVAGLATARGGRRRRAARRRRRHHAGQLRGVPVPGHAVRRPGPGRHRGAQRGAERRRRAGAGCSACSTRRPTSPTRARTASGLPRGPIDVRFEHVSFAYPGGPPVLHDVDVDDPAAHPGRGRRRDRLRQDDVRQAAHPADGPDRAGGCWSTASTLRDVRFDSLRARVVMVPQDGFLFDDTLAGQHPLRPARTRSDADVALARSPSSAWPTGSSGCRDGLGTAGRAARRVAVGGRAAAGRAGPRLPRRPRPAGARRGDLARSTRRPRCGSQRALDALTRGRTALTIAHRLSTAEAADEVLVFDARPAGRARPARRAGRSRTASTPACTRPGSASHAEPRSGPGWPCPPTFSG